MNFYSIFGFGVSFIIFYFGLRLSTPNLKMFWDPHGLLIVAGGTFAATTICFQFNRLFVIVKIFFRRLIFGKKYEFDHVVEELVRISVSYSKGETISTIKPTVKDQFTREGLTLIEDGIIHKDEMVEILEKRNDNQAFHYMQEAKKIKTISKFPPSFGVMATVIGMTVLFGELGGEDAMQKMGPAMAICLNGTLYGVAFSNLIFTPMGENLVEDTEEQYIKNQIVIEGLKLMMARQNPILIVEKLNSYLAPQERLDWKKTLAKA